MKLAIVLAGFLALGGAAQASAAGAPPSPAILNPAALQFTLPANIPWHDNGNGAQQAVLVGDPAKPGFYIVMNKFEPGHYSMPHFHPNDRYITVIKGTWWVGTGNHYDPEHNTVPMPAGSFVKHVAKQVHYDGAKNEEVILLIVGEGPATATQVPLAP
jgi:quercetin dioxygenase-like cupin family protein